MHGKVTSKTLRSSLPEMLSEEQHLSVLRGSARLGHSRSLSESASIIAGEQALSSRMLWPSQSEVLWL
jgi:hypothetical protein